MARKLTRIELNEQLAINIIKLITQFSVSGQLKTNNEKR